MSAAGHARATTPPLRPGTTGTRDRAPAQFRRPCSPPVLPRGGRYSTLSAKAHAHRSVRAVAAQAGGLQVSREFRHEPVMAAEVLALFSDVPAGVVVDATLGGAGHAAAILAARPDCELVGIDQDQAAAEAARTRLAAFGSRARVYEARFDALDAVVAQDAAAATSPVTGVLFDLGVSSHQLDTAARGFSYHLEGPLDMRMDPTRGQSAAELVNGEDEATLARLFAEHGEERFARRIARAICGHRPIATTTELAEVVAAAVPAAARRRGHPARRVFQALRVAVNEELDILAPALDSAVDLLAPRGRLVVLAYHSGEDRIVKERLRLAATGGCTCPPTLPCVCGARPTGRLLTRGARLASAAEIARNPRAKSVRLRALERLEVAGDTGGQAR